MWAHRWTSVPTRQNPGDETENGLDICERTYSKDLLNTDFKQCFKVNTSQEEYQMQTQLKQKWTKHGKNGKHGKQVTIQRTASKFSFQEGPTKTDIFLSEWVESVYILSGESSREARTAILQGSWGWLP